ncbi:GspH/FimT family pseudopilin [Vibrio sp. JC009]|uniref:GspH/FimT family pseudopilin n=1 Tax=Vibrio sp. JC009 TaxID=2912314 RepID=UPI0023B04672|nr:GspH/FimT family pseudopilin [Vibrio sp. JC009]WED21302.1 GspH/FimT family pseudopilin [Vibrio sp. JC009]
MSKTKNWEMVQGFTLIELIIALVIVSTLVTTAGLNISPVYQSYQIKQVATELSGFFYQARSEAVKRHKELFIHITQAGSEEGRWELALYETEEGGSPPILYASGDQVFLSANIGSSFSGSQNVIRLDRIHGNPVGNGNLTFFHKSSPGRQMRLVYYGVVGRIRICSVEEARYGYPVC